VDLYAAGRSAVPEVTLQGPKWAKRYRAQPYLDSLQLVRVFEDWCPAFPGMFLGPVAPDRMGYTAWQQDSPAEQGMQRLSRWLGRARIWYVCEFFFSAALTSSLLLAAQPASQPSNLLNGMDSAIRPGDDFFDYANGGWIKHTSIPPDRSSYGVFEELVELTDKRVADLIRGAAASSSASGTVAWQVATYYNSFMDEPGIEAKGRAPLQPTLDRIDAIKDRTMLAHFLGTTLRTNIDVLNNTQLHTDRLFGLWVAQDLDDPSHYAPFLVQGGLGMPDRDDYLTDSPHIHALQGQYRTYITSMLRMNGAAATDAEEQAARIYDLEHRLAETHVSRSDSEDVQRGHNHWTRQEFASRAPGLDWEGFFSGAQLAQQPTFVVWQPSAVKGIAALTASVPLSTWKEYLRFHALDHFGALLPKSFVDAHFAFYGKALSGTPQLPERWKRAVEHTNAALGDAVGQLYVQHYFSPDAKQRIEQLVHNLVAAFATHIDALEWMAPETRVQAHAKLASLKVGVGYPDHWRDYSGLKIVAGDAFGNAERAEEFNYQYNLAKLARAKVDRSEWAMVPQEVNAVNLPAMNALNFPAAMLQPPFFDPDRPAVLNYGSIGAVIGHEISHSFDDQGAQFDATGKLHDWWTPQDYTHFKASSAQLVKQFDAYKPFPDLAVNGRQTLSENIADLAGLAVSYSAYRASLGGREATPLEGFSGDQQFFISFAEAWRGKFRDPILRQIIISNGHAPNRYRASTVRNLDVWYKAFNVRPGEALYLPPGERVHMW
jgi:predicted metalloendopeptidase